MEQLRRERARLRGRSHWAPCALRPTNPVNARAAFRNPDPHIAVVASMIWHHPAWTRDQFAAHFKAVIDAHNAAGWGRSWPITGRQARDLADPAVDFETAWRAVDRDTVLAYGV